MLFSVHLQAIDPDRNLRRQYRVVVERDLLGACLVRQTYGRVGAAGRSLTTVVANESEARRLVRSVLRRRATAPQRIGVAYRAVEKFAVAEWQELNAILA